MATMFGFCKSDPSIPIEHLDYKYVETCQDSTKLQRILEILRSGDEGKYPALEEFTEKKLAKQKPKSSVLESVNLEKHLHELSEEEKLNVFKEINEIKVFPEFQDTRHDLPPIRSNRKIDVKSSNQNTLEIKVFPEFQDTRHDLPPIRSNRKIDVKSSNQNTLTESSSKCNKRVAPRSYDEWASLEKDIDNENNICNEKFSSKVKIHSNNLDASKILENEDIRRLKNKSLELQIIAAQNEKLKGNEAFRSGDYKEALVYYNRSLEMQNLTAVHNNRAITYIKLERYQEALLDCNIVLKEEPTNLKAYLRRGISNEALHRFHEAREDYQRVLDGEPRNKRALELLSKISKKMESPIERKGKRLKVEEINTKTEEVSIEAEEVTSKDDGVMSNDVKSKDGVNSKDTQIKYDEKYGDHKISSSNIQEFSGESKITTATPPIHFKPVSNISNIELFNSTSSLNNQNYKSQIPNDQIMIDPEQADHEALERKSMKNIIFEEDFMDSKQLNNSKTVKESKEDTQNSFNDLTMKKISDIFEKTKNLVENSNKTNCKNIKGDNTLVDNEKNSIYKHSERSLNKSSDTFVDKSSEISLDKSFERSSNKSSDKSSEMTFEKTSDISPAKLYGNESSRNSFVLFNRSNGTEMQNQESQHAKEVPSCVVITKDEANNFFNAGNYVSACEKYSLAINCLSEDSTGFEQALATLLCNRAACYLKIGHCKDCITDCTESIKLFPTLKAFLRRAAAFETLEKYTHAYIDYERALHYDHKSINTQQALTRISVLLKIEHGSSWRNALPTQADMNFNQALQDKKSSSNTNPIASDNQSMDFNTLKDTGNQYFKQGNIKGAIDFYSRCIDINPKEVASYTNRALCYLKMGDERLPDAISDCNIALKLEPNNVKALFRRALAYKASKCYKEALTDFSALLKLEPKNAAAKNEIEICKELYRKTLHEIQLNTETKKREFKGKRIDIEEVTSAENHMKIKHDQNSVPKMNPSKQLKKMSGFEFLQAWSIKTNKSSDHAELLKQIDVSKLPELLSNKLDGDFLQHFIRAVHDHFTSKESFKIGVQLMKHLSRTSRFVTILLFLNTSDKTMLKSTIELLELRAKNIDDKNFKQDVNSLRTTYKL